jgi:SAM-dependent methyltransferase
MEDRNRVSKKYVENGGVDYHLSSSRDYLLSEYARHCRAKYIFLELNRYIRNKPERILEYGSGYGQNLLNFEANEKYAYEPSLWIREQEIYPDISYVGSTDHFTSDYFDLILSIHSLEHTLQPLHELKEMHRLLRPRGQLIVVLPFERKLDFIETDPDYHLYSWTPRTIGNLLTETGFNIHETKIIYRAGIQRSEPLMGLSARLWLGFIRIYGYVRRVRDIIAVVDKEE